MATEKLDPRAVIAKMDADEKELADALAAIQNENEAKRKEMLEELRADDLADVKEKCKMHGFTASDLRGVLKAKGARKTVAAKSTGRKPAAKKRVPKAK